jgi:hypothetical protein
LTKNQVLLLLLLHASYAAGCPSTFLTAAALSYHDSHGNESSPMTIHKKRERAERIYILMANTAILFRFSPDEESDRVGIPHIMTLIKYSR